MQAGRGGKAWRWAPRSWSLFLQQKPGFCPHLPAQGIPEQKLGTARPWSSPPTGPPQPLLPFPCPGLQDGRPVDLVCAAAPECREQAAGCPCLSPGHFLAEQWAHCPHSHPPRLGLSVWPRACPLQAAFHAAFSPKHTPRPQHCRQAPYPRCSSRDQRIEPRAGAGCEAPKQVGGWLRGPPQGC